MAGKPSVDKWMRLAAQRAKAEDWQGAAEAYGAVLTQYPKNQRARKGVLAIRDKAVTPLMIQAQQARDRGAWAEAEEALGAAFFFAPSDHHLGLALGLCQLEVGLAPAALATAEQLLARQPDLVEALNLKGRAEREMGWLEAAQTTLEKARSLAPKDAQTLNNLGTNARSIGRKQEALALYRAALAEAPDDVTLHHNYAQVHRYQPGDAHLAQMQALAQKTGTQPAFTQLHFALFKALDDLGETEAAFDHLRQANAQVKASEPYDFQRDALPFALTKTLFDKPLALEVAPASPRPIFITGLPRTGTSLVERMLACTPGVQACGELPVVAQAVGRLMRAVSARPDKRLTQSDLQGLRAALLEGFARYSDGSPIMIDKMPLNFRWIGFILAALPEARVLHLSRDPMAVAWSLYQRDFDSQAHRFIYDPEDIARFMVLHRSYMDHWQAVYGGAFHMQSYEALVADPEAQGKAMAEALDLPWSDDWLHPEKAQSPTLTASFDQVRQPIYAGSNAGWRRYEAQLAPLKAALEAAGLMVAETFAKA